MDGWTYARTYMYGQPERSMPSADRDRVLIKIWNTGVNFYLQPQNNFLCAQPKYFSRGIKGANWNFTKTSSRYYQNRIVLIK